VKYFYEVPGKMIKKITDIFKEKQRTYSFEFFVPKTEEGKVKLFETVKELAKLNPDFISVTYGAGGTSKESTMDIVNQIQKRFNITTMQHITCIGHSRQDIAVIIKQMQKNGVRNVLALRGDPPKGIDRWEPHPEGFKYSYELCRELLNYPDAFSIGVAGFPEGHIDTPDKDTDTKYLKIKIDSGAQFVITQLFFNNRDYFTYVERLRKAGVTQRIIPGILPIVNYQKLINFCANCGATIPEEVHRIFKPLEGDDQATYRAGVQFAIKQCRELLVKGAPGLHFYTLNKVDPTKEILNSLDR
jgi:methylenetetrahydrofolate reductase (NADPH)